MALSRRTHGPWARRGSDHSAGKAKDVPAGTSGKLTRNTTPCGFPVPVHPWGHFRFAISKPGLPLSSLNCSSTESAPELLNFTRKIDSPSRWSPVASSSHPTQSSARESRRSKRVAKPLWAFRGSRYRARSNHGSPAPIESRNCPRSSERRTSCPETCGSASRRVSSEAGNAFDAAAEGLHVDRSIGSHSRLLRRDVRIVTRAGIEIRRLE